VVLGASSVVLGWKRLRVTFKSKAKKPVTKRYKTENIPNVAVEVHTQLEPQTQTQS